jgi:transcriptional regulator with XRE-family HTH domain
MVVAAIAIRFGKVNTINEGYSELDRYAADFGYKILGGFQKLVKVAERDYNIAKWFTYADNDLSWGKLYIDNGWSQVSCQAGSYYYIWRGKRYSRVYFQKHKFKSNPNLLYQEGLTESQLAELNGLWRVYDSGVSRFEKIGKLA